MNRIFSLVLFSLFFATIRDISAKDQNESAQISKVKDILIYKDAKFHSAFPSIVRRPDGELLVAFRRAPDWRPLGAKGYTHTDPNSYLVLTRSKDNGKNWSEPKIFSAHPWGGSQDPCMVQLRDKSILCASYAWAMIPPVVFPKLKQPVFNHGSFAFLGGYLLRSKDGGDSWGKPIIPPPSKDESILDIFGNLIPVYNRGAMCEGKDGWLFWVTASNDSQKSGKSSTHLMISENKGTTWKYSCVVGRDEKATFNESSIYETPKGDLVAFMRTENFGDHGCIARSTDHGKSFQKFQEMGFQGHPFYPMQLPDQRVLLVYGYRHPPFGVRARVLNPECTDFTTAKEIVWRDDGGGGDLGYPWATMISKKQAMVVYYFNIGDGTREIDGTILSLE